MRKMFQASLMMALAAISVAATAQSAGPVAVPRHVQDIITGRCALCHGPDGAIYIVQARPETAASSIRAWPRSIRIICRNSSGTFAMDGA